MSSSEREVVKGVTTVFPSGFRLGLSGDTLILEFLDDRDSHIEVIFSGAVSNDIVADLIEKFQQHLVKKNEE